MPLDLESRRPERPLVRWAGGFMRALVGLVLVLGMLASTSARRSAGERELTVEIDEDGEVVSREGTDARVVRDAGSAPGDSGVRELAVPRAPARLDPSGREPARPRWMRPRRVPPDDDPVIG